MPKASLHFCTSGKPVIVLPMFEIIAKYFKMAKFPKVFNSSILLCVIFLLLLILLYVNEKTFLYLSLNLRSVNKLSDLQFHYKANFINVHYVEQHLHKLEQDNSQLILYTRIKHLTPPSTQPYNLEGDDKTSETFSKYVAQLFQNKRNGIFIEAGANDGESASHTLYLEKELGWTGLLIECNPTVVPYLKWKHRKAWIADVCLSTTNHAVMLNFSNPVNWSFSGRIGKPWKLPKGTGSTGWTFFDVRAIPLYTILAGLGWTEIDFFSFDIEGQELNVFKVFPFDKITFKLLIVEVQFYNETERLELVSLLFSNGYVLIQKMENDYVWGNKKYRHLLRTK